MAYVYKQFSANDIATVPFNAHKQYDFTSASAVTNKVSTFSGQYTSESISLLLISLKSIQQFFH